LARWVGPKSTVGRHLLRAVKASPVARLAAAGAVVALTSTGCAAMGTQAETETVRIAADLELSGEHSEFGAVYRNALELRVEQVNQQGLLRGNRMLELEIRDNRSDPAVSANNLREFATDLSVSMIVSGVCADCLLSALDVIEAENIPTVSLAASSAVIGSGEDAPVSNVFKLGPNPDDVAAALVAEMIPEVETLAVVATDDLYGNDGRREILRAANTAGIEVVIDETLTLSGGGISSTTQQIANYQPEPEPGSQLVQQRQSGPDAVVAWGLAPFGVEVAANLRGAGYEGELFLDPGAADELFILGTATEALTGATMVFTETLVIDEVIATSPAKANRRNWFNDYTARHGTYHAFSSLAADAVEILVFAINRIDSSERGALTVALESIEIDGLTGPIRMSPQHHSGLMTQALTTLVAHEDRWRLAG
jgi:branched-chain amino acid transport system substrate-binding protein